VGLCVNALTQEPSEPRRLKIGTCIYRNFRVSLEPFSLLLYPYIFKGFKLRNSHTSIFLYGKEVDDNDRYLTMGTTPAYILCFHFLCKF
jgi:hypothetical protein